MLSGKYTHFSRFDFVKVIGSSLHPRNLPIGMDFTAKVLLGIVKQGPVYLRSRRSLEVGEDSDSD